MNRVSTARRSLRRLTGLRALLALALAGVAALALHSSFTASAQQGVTVVNAASYEPTKTMSPDGIGAAYGAFITQNNGTFGASGQPLPTTLGGVRVRVGGVDAGIFFVSPGQINFLVPSTLADNANTNITVTNSNNTTLTGTFPVVRSSPGIFTAKSDGTGAPAGLQTFDGVTYKPISTAAGVALDVDPGTKQRPNILVLYGTNIRNTPAANPTDGNGVAESVTAKIQGVTAPVLYAGQAPGFAGLDQLNIAVPPELGGIGNVTLTITANGRTSNAVALKIGGTQPDVRSTPIAFGQQVSGELTADDQVQTGSGSKTYFFDAYNFETTAANTTIAVDLRSTAFDAAVLLYRIDTVSGKDVLTLLAADDQTGGYGNGNIEGNNALLLTVLPNPGRYAVFATSSDFNENGTGAYTLRLLKDVITPIAYGQSAASPAITTTDLQTSLGTYLDAYWFSGAANDNVQINMGSTAFDSYLILQRRDGDPPIAFDDNTGGGSTGRDARIVKRLDTTDIYIIIATPFEPNKTGAYTLSLQKLAGFGAGDELNLWRAPGRELNLERAGGGTTFERSIHRRVLERQ